MGLITDLSVLPVKVLPDPVEPINLAVMEPEDRITGADEGVSSRIAANGEVTAAMDTEFTSGVARVTLEVGLEVLDVGRAQNQRGAVVEAGEFLGNIAVQVTLEAPEIVTERVCDTGRVGVAVVGQRDRTKAHRQAAEGPGGHATAAGAGRKGNDGGWDGLRHHEAGMGDVLPVAAERGRRAVEDGRRLNTVDVQAPFPVWEIAGIPAVVELLLVPPNVIPMPGKKRPLIFLVS